MTETPSLRTIVREALRIALPFFRSGERWIAIGLFAAVIGAQLALVGTAVANNYWRNAFFQTLQDKNWPGFIQQFWVYFAIGIVFILATVYQRYFTQWLVMRWRRWLTAQYLDRWLDGPVHYRTMIVPGTVDNPDQRIAEDIRQFIEVLLGLTVGLLGAIATLFSFVAILWTLSSMIPLTIFSASITIPGYLVWAAVLYALLGSVVAHWIGRRLIALDFEQERREADFRFALVRLRENGEAVALLRGENSEKQELLARFRAITQNWYRLMSRQQFVGLFAETYRRYSVYFPYFAMAPLFFGGSMQLGAFMQSGSAFNEVRSSFSYFISSYLKIAELSAIVQRLSQFQHAIARDDAVPAQPDAPSPSDTTALRIENLTVAAPNQTTIMSLDELRVAPGEAVLITGASGAGKTSLLRSLNGVWPNTSGLVQSTASRPLMLPQRAYLPLGSLRRALSYPADMAAYDDGQLAEALDAVGLTGLTGMLDTIERWDTRLSEGEKQRLSVARALLFEPDLLMLDEATAALDEASEIELHRLIRNRLPGAAILAVSHRDALAEVYDRSIRIDGSQSG